VCPVGYERVLFKLYEYWYNASIQKQICEGNVKELEHYFFYLFILFYIPWNIWGKLHLDIGIVNISRNALYNMC